jgi:hypothetical protein
MHMKIEKGNDELAVPTPCLLFRGFAVGRANIDRARHQRHVCSSGVLQLEEQTSIERGTNDNADSSKTPETKHGYQRHAMQHDLTTASPLSRRRSRRRRRVICAFALRR